MNDETPRQRPTFGFSSNRTTGTHRVRYREGTMIDPQECVLCIPVDEVRPAAQTTKKPPQPTPER